MRENFYRLLNSVHLDCFVSWDKVYVGCGPTRWCLVFCSPSRLFHHDPKLTTVYLDLVPFRSFPVTLSSLPSTGTGKKRGTATQTAPNQTAGPLVVTRVDSEWTLHLQKKAKIADTNIC